jgi:hypothetical protein
MSIAAWVIMGAFFLLYLALKSALKENLKWSPHEKRFMVDVNQTFIVDTILTLLISISIFYSSMISVMVIIVAFIMFDAFVDRLKGGKFISNILLTIILFFAHLAITYLAFKLIHYLR